MRSLAFRLAAAVSLIALGAVAVVALLSLPTLQRALVQQDLDRLAATARAETPALAHAIERGASDRRLRQAARAAGDATATRVTILGIPATGADPSSALRVDSSQRPRAHDLQFDVALEAAAERHVVTATQSGPDGRIGQAAVPVTRRDRHGRERVVAVAVFSRAFPDVLSSTALVQRRILLAGLAGLVLATIAGYGLAWALTRRVRTLQRVAGRVAEGDLTTPFPVGRGGDELEALAAALEDMRGQLAELDSARKRFIATASHELRTPLFSLGGFLELLEDEDVEEQDRRRFVRELRQQVLRMQQLATDLLDLSRLEAGQLELREREVDLAELARLVAREFEPRMAASDGQLELRLPTQPLIAVCDPERVGQILRNLLDNALTHTPDGTDVVVALSHRDGHVRLGVADYGPGIGRELLPRVFEPFATGDDGRGAGLGLPIARELATRMNGRLHADSRPGLTTFTLELPARSPLEVTDTVRECPENPPSDR